jgi:hypothetical protein
MPEVEIEVAYVNQPGPGRKRGSVKSANGQYYGVDPGMLGLFQQGGRYKIFYEDNEFKGKIYSVVKTVSPLAAPTPSTGGKSAERDEQIWVNSMLQRAIELGKVDALDEEACVWFGEVQKRVHKRLFHNDETSEQQRQRPDSGLKVPGNVATPPSGQAYSKDLDDSIPF